MSRTRSTLPAARPTRGSPRVRTNGAPNDRPTGNTRPARIRAGWCGRMAPLPPTSRYLRSRSTRDSVERVDRAGEIAERREVDVDEVGQVASFRGALAGAVDDRGAGIDHRRVVAAGCGASDEVVHHEESLAGATSVRDARECRRAREGVRRLHRVLVERGIPAGCSAVVLGEDDDASSRVDHLAERRPWLSGVAWGVHVAG